GGGTSTAAALLALAAAGRGTPTLLVDADEGLGTLPLLLGVRPRGTLGMLRGGATEPRDLLVPLGDTLDLLPGGAGDPGAPPLAPAERRALFRRVAALYGGYGLVVVDGGSRLDSVLAACSAGAGRLLAVATPERIALAGAYALLKAVHERVPGLAVEVLLNEADETGVREGFEHLRTAAGLFLDRAVELAGALPSDSSLRAGVGAGMPLQDAAAASPTALAADRVAARLLR
ncbi:MAG TPA: hypothetical protein VF263_26795, partial [Longimicrobiaceae bacterium]